MYFDWVTWSIWLIGFFILVVWIWIPIKEIRNNRDEEETGVGKHEHSTGEGTLNFADYTIIFLFLVSMFAIGSIFYKWVGSSDDFYVAGRNLTPFVLAAVLAATNINLYSFIGQSGIAYKYGIPIIWQTWTGNMAMVFSGLFIIPIYQAAENTHDS